MRHWSVVGRAALVDALAPLVAEWQRRGAQVAEYRLAQVEGLGTCLERLLKADEEASVGKACEVSLRLVLEEPSSSSLRERFVGATRGRASATVTGWLRMDAAALAAYAARAVSVLRRPVEAPAPLVLLGPREARYQSVLDEAEACAAGADGLRTLRWSAERIRKLPLLRALRLGAAAAIYVGHGNRQGWLAYGGLSTIDLISQAERCAPEQTTALFFALGCGGAAPEGIADALVAQGVAGTVLAPTGDPLHADNRRLALALVEALAQGHRELPQLLAAVRQPMAAMPGAGYVVIGDPGLGAFAAPGALARGFGVFAPRPDQLLVPADVH